jgi:hypothetical protein
MEFDADAMAEIHLRRITADNEQECLSLRVNDAQAGLVGTNAQSLAMAKANPRLVRTSEVRRLVIGGLDGVTRLTTVVLYGKMGTGAR